MEVVTFKVYMTNLTYGFVCNEFNHVIGTIYEEAPRVWQASHPTNKEISYIGRSTRSAAMALSKSYLRNRVIKLRIYLA